MLSITNIINKKVHFFCVFAWNPPENILSGQYVKRKTIHNTNCPIIPDITKHNPIVNVEDIIISLPYLSIALFSSCTILFVIK